MQFLQKCAFRMPSKSISPTSSIKKYAFNIHTISSATYSMVKYPLQTEYVSSLSEILQIYLMFNNITFCKRTPHKYPTIDLVWFYS